MSDSEKAEPKLAAAVCAVMGEVRRLEKADKNAHGNYVFTSVDDFKDHLRPLLAKHGLSVKATEKEFGFESLKNKKGEETLTAKIRFGFTLEHSSGETSAEEESTVALPYTGAQTTGAARSYAIKEWLKTRFLASSGDLEDEADLRNQAEFSGEKLTKADARPVYEALMKEMGEVELTRDPAALYGWWADNRQMIIQLPNDWHLKLKSDYAERWKALKEAEKIDRSNGNGNGAPLQ